MRPLKISPGPTSTKCRMPWSFHSVWTLFIQWTGDSKCAIRMRRISTGSDGYGAMVVLEMTGIFGE